MSKDLITTVLKDEDYDKWDKFIEESDQGTIFHKSYWLRHTGNEFLIFCCVDNNTEILGGLVVFYKTFFRFKYCIHSELTPYSGILLKRQIGKVVKANTFLKKITSALLDAIENKSFWCITSKLIYSYNDLQTFKWHQYVYELRYTYILKNKDINTLWSGIEDKRKADINKAVRNGLKIDINENNIKDFLALNKETFRRQGLNPAVSEAQILNYHKILLKKKQVKIFMVKTNQDVPCAGVYLVYDRKRAYYLMGGSNYLYKDSGAASYALWEAIKYTFGVLNLEEFDFEGTDIQSREKFFREYGGNITPYFQVTKWGSRAKKLLFYFLKSVYAPYRKIRRVKK